VVASARAGGAEVIADGLNGAVVDPTDASAVAAGLARFRESARDVGEAARRSAEPFTYGAQVGAFQRVYERLSPARCDFP
jgi:glycosyltransferase involved in cell wall biosynthesis